jgi:hypothetical protein
MENALSSRSRKMDKTLDQSPFESQNNGQGHAAQVIDFCRKVACPSKANSGVDLMGTLPAKRKE